MFSLVLLVAVTACVTAESSVVGGVETSIDQFPYQASVENNGTFLCSGVIISARNVLTSDKKMTRWVDGGFHVRVGSDNQTNGQVLKVSSYTFHDATLKANGDGDIVIISLAKPIGFGPAVQSIPLVREGQEPGDGDILTAVQWSSTQDVSTAEVRRRLIKARVPIIDHDLCDSVYNEANKTMRVRSHFLCAGGGLHSTILDNDTGGALINAENHLVGIVAWGEAKPGYPGVFTSIANPEVQKFIRYHAQGFRIAKMQDKPI